MLFRGDSPEVAEGFAKADPYVTSGAVKRWHVREWKTVAGEDAATPLRPDTLPAGKKTLSDSSNAVGPGGSSQDKGLVLRMWRARATVEKSGEYVEHATRKVFPALSAIEGHRGAYLLRRAVDGAIELVGYRSLTATGQFRTWSSTLRSKAIFPSSAANDAFASRLRFALRRRAGFFAREFERNGHVSQPVSADWIRNDRTLVADERIVDSRLQCIAADRLEHAPARRAGSTRVSSPPRLVAAAPRSCAQLPGRQPAPRRRGTRGWRGRSRRRASR